MDKKTLDDAFNAIGSTILEAVTVVVGGSAAFVLAGTTTRNANDCDLLLISPEDQKDNLFAAADRARHALGLEDGWLNDAMAAWDDDTEDEDAEEAVPEFPEGWQDRVEDYQVFGRLTVRLVGRSDALALKARTTQERGDRTDDHEKDFSMLEEVIRAARPTLEEFNFVINYLNGLDHIDTSRIVVVMAMLKDEIHPRGQ